MKWENLKNKIDQIECTPVVTFSDVYPNSKDNKDLTAMENYLYHGVRFDNKLCKLENIFKTRKIVCGNNSPYYSNYGDNCNDGEYVSLVEYSKNAKSTFDTFIIRTVSLIISPGVNAIKTEYLPFNEWDLISDKTSLLKHRYSYAKGEYQVKDFIPIEDVMAIGIPKALMVYEGGGRYADYLLERVQELFLEYDISLPIVDTSNSNKLLVPKHSYDVNLSSVLDDFSIPSSNNLKQDRFVSGYKVYKKRERFMDNSRNKVSSLRKY